MPRRGATAELSQELNKIVGRKWAIKMTFFFSFEPKGPLGTIDR